MAINLSTDRRFNRPAWWSLAMYLALFVISVGSFYILDLQGIWMGDDLGYMFTDSTLHRGDGKILTSPLEVFTTQASHWQNCNGRYLVHTIVQLIVGFVGKDIFCAMNAVMFGLLVLLTCRLSLPVGRFSLGSGVAVALILWLCLPRPGVTMLSLVSYSVNYMWTAVVILLFLLLWRAIEEHRVKRNGIVWVCIFSVFAAMWQESFSVPVSAALVTWWCVNAKRATGREISIILCFIAGTCLLVLAPGNFHHAVQGGGIAPQALLAKVTSLGKDLMISPVSFLAVAIIVWTCVKPGLCARFCGENLTLFAAVLASIVLAGFSYTAIRQLFAPFLFSAIIIIRMFCGENVTYLLNRPLCLLVGLAIYAGVMVGAYRVREYPQEISRSILHQATAGNRALFVPPDENPKSPLQVFLFDRFNDDPVNGRDLHLVFDKYTKQGLSRLYSPRRNPRHISTIIPVPLDELKARAAMSKAGYSKQYFGKDGKVAEGAPLTIRPVSLTPRYDCFRIPETQGKPVLVRSPKGKRFSYERIIADGYVYYVVPAGVGTLTTADTKAIREKRNAELDAKRRRKAAEKAKEVEYRHVHHPSNPTSPESLRGE